ncbi:hypothetical protein L6452_32393 [Arctium lappa]|uniref:Uncharacterized protein n=1 Tax=Arctium lappa TaxID=4217 RepID=A0ACB8Z5C6_ARCLA|nr:hypothetical protein L6452_32393 [Arctium lappa]
MKVHQQREVPFVNPIKVQKYQSSLICFRRRCSNQQREVPFGFTTAMKDPKVLMDDINVGYERLADLQVKKVNNIEINNLKHMCQLVEECKEERLRLDLNLDDECLNATCHAATNRQKYNT